MRISPATASLMGVVVTLLYPPPAAAQTYTDCNPLTSGSCPADPALGKSINIDFTTGASNDFTSSGAPTFGSNGAEFTVAKSGDSPLITSKWYIMFGHVDFEIQAAPGVGIVSSAVLQSDCLDEIDWEWLGGDDTQAQSNYFGKGITTDYNRGAFHAAPGNHDSFHKYSVDWTSEQITWEIDDTTVRTLTPAEADSGQYPQTPMMVKVGAWSGGDSANAAGTIAWAGGQTNYAAGPYTMYLKSISVTDYSTGKQYTYSGTSGTWQSIQSDGGTVDGNIDGKAAPPTSSAPPVTSIVSNIEPMPLASSHQGGSSMYVTPDIWPWVTTAAASSETAVATGMVTSIAGLPSGWIITPSGKVQPPPSSASAITVPVYLTLLFLLAGLGVGFGI